jgi:protein-S-isoprenylcysteine O-methyltransferase Ste14
MDSGKRNVESGISVFNRKVNFKDKRILQRLRVPLGFLFAAVFLLFAKPQPLTLIIGAFIAVGGLLVRAWASGHIRKNRQLTVSGIYAHTRNPLYLGSFIIGVGFMFASGVWWLGVIFVALSPGIYLPVMSVEAVDLARLFGAEFEEYKRNVPNFLPRLRAWKKSEAKFDFQLYLMYREYRAAIGLLAALGILAVKTFLIR